jgi:hypothetical protein
MYSFYQLDYLGKQRCFGLNDQEVFAGRVKLAFPLEKRIYPGHGVYTGGLSSIYQQLSNLVSFFLAAGGDKDNYPVCFPHHFPPILSILSPSFTGVVSCFRTLPSPPAIMGTYYTQISSRYFFFPMHHITISAKSSIPKPKPLH